MTRISDFFHNQQTEQLDSTQKASIYASFLEKRNHQTAGSILKIYKWISFGMTTVAIVALLFSGNFFGIMDNYSGEINQQSVDAQVIGKIVSSSGSYMIYDHNNRPIAGTMVTLSDIVSIEDKSRVEVLISDDFTAQVSGPAQFKITLNKSGDGYRLSFVNGGENISVNSTKESDKNISIQSSDGVLISNSNPSREVSFSVHRDGTTKQRSIINKSDTTLKVSKENDNKNNIIIAANHSANISQQDDDSITLVAQQQIEDLIATGSQAVNSGSSVSHQPTVVTYTISDKEIAALRLITDKAFMNSDYDDLMVSYLLGKSENYDIALNNINKRLDRIADLTHSPHQTHTTLEGLIHYTQDLIKSLQSYDVAQIQYSNLLIMIDKFKELMHQHYGAFKETDQYKKVDADYIKKIIEFDQNLNYL